MTMSNPSPPPIRRYLPARAFPNHAFLPGRGARPVSVHPGARVVLGEANWRTHEEYLWGVDLYNAGFVWEAHEAWESIWRSLERQSTEHLLLQGLIQCAAACVKSALGDGEAMQRITRRASSRLVRVQSQRGSHYLGVPLTNFIRDLQVFAGARPNLFESRPRLVLSFG